jgi:hypothetical protein
MGEAAISHRPRTLPSADEFLGRRQVEDGEEHQSEIDRHRRRSRMRGGQSRTERTIQCLAEEERKRRRLLGRRKEVMLETRGREEVGRGLERRRGGRGRTQAAARAAPRISEVRRWVREDRRKVEGRRTRVTTEVVPRSRLLVHLISPLLRSIHHLKISHPQPTLTHHLTINRTANHRLLLLPLPLKPLLLITARRTTITTTKTPLTTEEQQPIFSWVWREASRSTDRSCQSQERQLQLARARLLLSSPPRLLRPLLRLLSSSNVWLLLPPILLLPFTHRIALLILSIGVLPNPSRPLTAHLFPHPIPRDRRLTLPRTRPLPIKPILLLLQYPNNLHLPRPQPNYTSLLSPKPICILPQPTRNVLSTNLPLQSTRKPNLRRLVFRRAQLRRRRTRACRHPCLRQ